MLIATVSSAAFLLVTDLSIIELDQAQLRNSHTETPAAETTSIQLDEAVAENSSESIDAFAATWAKEAVKQRRRRD